MFTSHRSKVSPLNVKEKYEKSTEDDDPRIHPNMNPITDINFALLGVVKMKSYCCSRRKGKFEEYTGIVPDARRVKKCGSIDDDNKLSMVQAMNGILLKEIVDATNSRNDRLDIDRIRWIVVDQGADIDARDAFGQTILHEVARSWSVDVAKFLVEELKANPNISDDFGRTPLHVAAGMNYGEMCSYFISIPGVDKEAKTKDQLHTPLFIAAANDAPCSLRELIKQKCCIEAKDFKGRTPLFVAAELDRTESARVLLDLGAKADVLDNSGQPVLVPLVNKMAAVALEALNQFHYTVRSSRKQYFHLCKLEGAQYWQNTSKDDLPDKLKQTDDLPFPSPMECMLSSSSGHQLVMHDSIRKLIDVKWEKFAMKWIVLELFLQIFYTLCWSIFALLIDWKANPVYGPDYNGVMIARLIFLIFGLIILLREIIVEIKELRYSKKNHELFKQWKCKELEEELAFCHPRWSHEREYIQNEINDVLDPAHNPTYFKNAWNFFDWACFIFQIASFLLHLVHVGTVSLVVGRYQVRILAITILMLWIRLLKVFRAFELLGPLIVIMGYMIPTTLKFLFLYLVFYIPFAINFWMLFGGTQNLPSGQYAENPSQTTYDASTLKIIPGYDYVHNMLFSLLRLTVVDDYPYDDFVDVDRVTAQLIIGIWISLSAVILLNIFIAMLSDTFQRIYDNSVSNAIMQKATLIMEQQKGLTMAMRQSFIDFLINDADPLEESYDDDIETEDVQKAAIQIRTIVNDLSEKFNEFVGNTEEEEDQSPLDPKFYEERQEKDSMLTGAVRRVVTKVWEEKMGTALTELKEQVDESERKHAKFKLRVKEDLKMIKSSLKDICTILSGGKPSDEVGGASHRIIPGEPRIEID